jgi:S-adenosylmethionine synthetase
MINQELYLARKLNRAIYEFARGSDNLGLDIKTQITIDESGHVKTAIVAVPMRSPQNIDQIVIDTLGQVPDKTIINGTGIYTYHSSVADCGMTGRKLACDFYSTAAPIGGGSPWTKDGSKSDLTLNLYARQMAIENLGDNDECVIYLSSCIGRSELPSGTIKTICQGATKSHSITPNKKPRDLIRTFGLDKPIFADLCRNGLFSIK